MSELTYFKYPEYPGLFYAYDCWYAISWAKIGNRFFVERVRHVFGISYRFYKTYNDSKSVIFMFQGNGVNEISHGVRRLINWRLVAYNSLC